MWIPAQLRSVGIRNQDYGHCVTFDFNVCICSFILNQLLFWVGPSSTWTRKSYFSVHRALEGAIGYVCRDTSEM